MHGVGFVQSVLSNPDFIEQVKSFNEFGTDTIIELFEWEIDGKSGVVEKAINEYWTSGQRQAHSLHEISYRACYKPQLPRFFIERLTQQGDAVYDPFMGRGTTQLESWLMGRKPLGNDINPLSKVLLEPRLNPPSLEQIEKRLNEIDLRIAKEEYPELLAFYHRDTLTQIIALKEYLLGREESGEIDNVDKWIRMVAINRLTGHSNGFFSVYTLPPNQAVSIRSQERINERRNQTPESKDIIPRIVRKSKSLLRKWRGLNLNQQADNWLRCWFIDIDSSTIEISQLKKVDDWQNAMTEVLKDLYRIVKTGGYVAFEVGEVRNGKVLLEELVVPAGLKAGLEPIIIMINSQDFTKTANAWGVKNQTQGTNTNRIVVFQKQS
jgi:hypothetical protein